MGGALQGEEGTRRRGVQTGDTWR